MSLSPHVAAHVRVMYDSHARGQYASHACGLCMFRVLLVHAAYARPSVVALHPRSSRTPKIFHSMTQTIILALQSVGFKREKTMTISLFGGGRQLSLKVIRKPYL